MKTSLSPDAIRAACAGLAEANAEALRRRPGESAAAAPVHTVYGGAHLFRAETAQKLGALALAVLDEHALTGAELAAALGISTEAAEVIRHRCRA